MGGVKVGFVDGLMMCFSVFLCSCVGDSVVVVVLCFSYVGDSVVILEYGC